MSNTKTLDFECEECKRRFNTKQGMNQHKTKTHRKAGRAENMKRMRSEEKQLEKIKCKNCAYECKSEFALKTHKSHAHKEVSSPENKKQKTDESEKSLEIEMKTIEPTQEFLTKTAKTLAEALDAIQDKIDDDEEDEAEEIEDEELTRRLMELRDTGKPKSEDDYLVTVPVKDVEELRIKLRNAELKVEELKEKLETSEAKNKNLLEKVVEFKNKKPESPEINEPEWLKPQFQCDQCKKKFILRSNLLKHILQHNLPGNVSPAVDPRPEEEDRSEETTRPEEDAKTDDEVEYRCHKCGGMFPSEEEVKEHIERRHREQAFPCTDCHDHVADSEEALESHKKFACKDFTCLECDYQTNTEEALIKHMNDTHHKVKSPPKQKNCHSCDQIFNITKDLMKHRKEVHPTTKICKFFNTEKGCNYGEECIYVHIVKMVVGDDPTPVDTPTSPKPSSPTPPPSNSPQLTCRTCGESFNSKHNLMNHRKQVHIQNVRQCRDYEENKCRRGEDRCWYKHQSTQQAVPQKQQTQRAKQPQNFQQNQQVDMTPVQTNQQTLQQIIQMLSQLVQTQTQ